MIDFSHTRRKNNSEDCVICFQTQVVQGAMSNRILTACDRWFYWRQLGVATKNNCTAKKEPDDHCERCSTIDRGKLGGMGA